MFALVCATGGFAMGDLPNGISKRARTESAIAGQMLDSRAARAVLF